MYTKEYIITDLSIATGSLMGTLNSCPDNIFHINPGEGKWSVAEVAEHLAILEKLIVQVMNGPKRTTEREPDAKIAQIKKIFENHDTKLTSPEVISPQNGDLPKDELLTSIQANRDALFAMAGKEDLNMECTAHSHAVFKELTGLEWIYFAIYHGDRHLHQLFHILKAQSSQSSFS